MAIRILKVAPELFEALRRLDAGPHTVELAILTAQPRGIRGTVLEGNQARRYNMNRIRKWALEQGYDYLVKMDYDMIPPPHALMFMIRKLESLHADICTSLTPERPKKCRTDEFSQVMSWNGNKGAREAIDQPRTFECTGNAGEGFMLMSRRALSKVVWPPYKSCGDFAFWREVHKQGLKVICTPWVICAHKDRSGELIRGRDWICSYWCAYIRKNKREGRKWFHGLPYKWPRAETPLGFLEKLPGHLKDQTKEPKWFLYHGRQR